MNDKKSIYNFANHRQIWKTKPFLDSLFGKNVNMKSIPVKNLLNTLDNIPISESYTIAAYGSLLNHDDILRTMPSADFYRKGYIYGYERIFNVGRIETGCVLNIQKQPNATTICNFITISYKDLPRYILREGWYDVVTLNQNEYKDGWEVQDPVLTVVGKEPIILSSVAIEPQLNYLHLCLSGMKETAGWEGVQNFIHNTLCYSKKEADYIPVIDWLDNLDLINYFLTTEYNKR